MAASGAEASAPEPAVYSEVGEALESDFFPLLRVNPEDAGWEDFSQNPCNSPGWTYVYCDKNTLTGVFYAPPLSNQQDQQHYSAGTPEDFRRQGAPLHKGCCICAQLCSGNLHRASTF